MEINDNHKHNGVKNKAEEESYLLENKDTEHVRSRRTASIGRKVVFMIACMMQQLICNGIGYGLSIMYAELIIVFDAKRSEVALIQSIYMAIATGAGIIFSSPIKKIGPGKSIIIGSIIGCTGLFASSFADGLVTIIICTGVVASMGMCICYLSSFISVSLLFHEDAGKYLATLSVGSSLGQFIVPIFYEIFIAKYSWSGAFILLGGIAFQNIPFGVIVHCSKDFYVTGSSDKSTSVKPSSICDLSVLKNYVLWIILINFHLIALTGNFESWFLVDLMVSRGFTRESGSILVTVLGFANVAGRVIGGFIRFKCINIPSVYHWVYLCPILAVGHVLMININDFWGLLAVCLLYGIPFGVVCAEIAVIIFELMGLDKYPQTMAITNLVLGLANLFSGQIGGNIKDIFGDYDLAFYIAAGSSIYVGLTMLLVAIIVKKRKQKQFNSSSQNSNTNSYELLK